MLIESRYPNAELGFGYHSTSFSLPERPSEIAPIFDKASTALPLPSFSSEIFNQSFGSQKLENGSNCAPCQPAGFRDPYLYPMLTRSERLRLTLLWYHTKDFAKDEELLRKMQEKIDLLKALLGWEFAICGLLDCDVFHRVVTVGLPLANLPRRESTCSHTVQQEPGTVFLVSDMSRDWRFAASPHVSQGGLRSYAGTPLRCHLDDGEDIALGSLCVASNTADLSLDHTQKNILVKFADMIMEDIMNGSRRRRANQQTTIDVLLREIALQSHTDRCEKTVMESLKQVYPDAIISVTQIENSCLQLYPEGPTVMIPSDKQATILEDHDYIDDLLKTNNHEKMEAARPVRFIVSKFSSLPLSRALVVATPDLTQVFDDIDVRFVRGCASSLFIAAQERILQEALKAKEQFLRGVTHQLRTPIHGILGAVDLLAAELAAMNEDASQSLRMIRNSGRELMSTVNNVLKFSRWAEKTGSSEPAILTDLARLEPEILEDVSNLLPEQDLDKVSLSFDNQLAEGSSLVTIDYSSLKDCLQPLVLNALQNTPSGSVVVEISATPDYSSLIFDVKDTGYGIEVADHQRIFDPYVTVNDRVSGVGLGLTLVRRTAGELKGTINLVASQPGKGSHFRAEFRDPGFSCGSHTTKMHSSAFKYLPDTFSILASDPPCATTNHLKHVLKAGGMQESAKAEGAVTILEFIDQEEEFQCRLRSAVKARVAVCLLPSDNDVPRLKAKHPQIVFFGGPYTLRKLDQILLETSEAFQQSRIVPVFEPLASASLEVNCNGRAHTPPVLTETGKPSQRDLRTLVPQCLLVDDNAINLRILRMYCDKRSLPYRTALDGLQAIDEYDAALKDKPISLILLDLQMPKCDGIQACLEIRAREAREGLQPAVIFIITGQDSQEDRKKSLAAGADQFFVKPLSLKSLERAISDYF